MSGGVKYIITLKTLWNQHLQKNREGEGVNSSTIHFLPIYNRARK
jgi:hypothetical protein